MPQTSQLSKECLYTALLQLMETTPYDQISITDITARAGVSRMAYYRNYESKDDILLQRMEELLSDFQREIYLDESITAKEFWPRYFWKFHKEPIVAAMMQANLLDQMSIYHVKTTYEIFTRKFLWDLSKEENMMLLYSRIGGVVGLIRFSVEHNGNIDKEYANFLLDRFADLSALV